MPRALPAAATAVVVLFAPCSAGAAIDSIDPHPTASPGSQLKNTAGPAAVDLALDLAYSGDPSGTGGCTGAYTTACSFFPPASRIVTSLSSDFAINPGSLPQCPPASLQTATTAAEARAACPGSFLGEGTVTVTVFGIFTIPGFVNAFNGVPSGGDPEILFYMRFDPPLSNNIVLSGTLISPSILDIFLPLFAGGSVAITQFESSLDNISNGSGTLVSARCTGPGWTSYTEVFFYDGAVLSKPYSQACVSLSKLTVIEVGSGTGQVNGAGISCPPDCTHTANPDQSFSLVATPSAGSRFTGWGGDCTAAGRGACTLAATSDRVVAASFEAVPKKKKKKKKKKKQKKKR